MKKVLVSMIAVLMISFTACNSGKKQDATQEATPEATQEVQATPASGSKIDEYKKLIEQATPLLEKVAKGDVDATKEYTEIAEKMAAISTELQTELANDPQKWQEFADVMQKFSEEAAKTMQGAQ
ncbi:MAG: hypothetical protein LBE91_19795 [Tannerella sp.]|jgi:exopolysaccharide biosynthesis protein|nr:hypothetical protein [Tannerella sp.]